MLAANWNFDLDRVKPTTTSVVALYLETFLIAPLVQAPPVVAMGFCIDGGKVHVVAANDTAFDAVTEELFGDRSLRIVGHNLRVDLACLLAHGAMWGKRRAWADMIFSALAEDRAECTLLREKLISIAKANPMEASRRFDLGTCCEKWKTPTQPNKADEWRLRWGELAHLSVSQYPADATKYLVEDVRAAYELYRAQQSRSAWLKDAKRQTRASFALTLMSAHGLSTDPEVVAQVHAETVEDLRLAREICVREGLVRPNGVKDQKAAMARQVAAYAARGLDAPRGNLTEQQPYAGKEANVKLDEESCLKSGDPVMKAYTKCAQAQTLLAKVERLMHPVIQPYFDPLMETGRTSCSQGKDPKPGQAPSAHGAQVQNPPREVTHICRACEGVGCLGCAQRGEVAGLGIRECYRARPRRVLLDIDYAVMELRCLAQIETWWFGRSALGDILNDPSRDPHIELGAAILEIPLVCEVLADRFPEHAVDLGWAIELSEHIDFCPPEKAEQVPACLATMGVHLEGAIVGNTPEESGYVRGTLAAELVEMLRRNAAKDIAYAMKTNPKAKKKLSKLRGVAKGPNFGHPGGMGAKRLVDYCYDVYGFKISEATAKRIIRLLKKIYPERGPYLQRISDWSTAAEGRFRFTHPYSERVRGGLGYSNGANNPFQGLASDAAKEALWRVAVHCYALTDSALYGSRPVNFVHDQVQVETDEERYQAAATTLNEVWCAGAQAVVPDIRIMAEAAACRRWDKAAGDPVFWPDGQLAIYEDWLRSRAA